MASKKRRGEKKKPYLSALDKFIVEEKKDLMKEKMEKISEIVAETENEIKKIVKKKVKIAKIQYKIKKKQLSKIKKAGLEYNSISSRFKPAMPRTEEERLQDIKDLKNAISILESYDDESYEVEPKKIDVGLGIFYEKMSRRFLSIINNQNLKQYNFIPIQRLEYYAFLDVKNLKLNDVLPILNIMKDTNLLNDIIEIGPSFYIIVFVEEKLELTLSDKVLLTFAYEEDFLTIKKLIELTEWKKDYAEKVIKNLMEKGVIIVQDDIIKVDSFGNHKERKKWNKVIQDEILKEKQKLEESQRRTLERKTQLEQRLSTIERAEISEAKPFKPEMEKDLKKIKFEKKIAVKPLPKKILQPQTELNEKKILKQEQEIKDKDDLLGAMEALDEIMPPRSDLDVKDSKKEEPDLKDLVPEIILSYHEKFSIINGGLSQYEKIEEYIKQKVEGVPENLIETTLEQLKELRMIRDSIKIGENEFYLFNEISLSDNEKNFINFAINKKPLKKEEFKEGLKWDEEKVLKTMKNLQEKGILRIEKNEIIIPGIIQEVK